MPSERFDLFVIGAGSGGVRAARVAAGHGARVAIAEDHRVGGTCVIRGCVPKKLMVFASAFGDEFALAGAYGWQAAEPVHDWAVLRDAVQREVTRLEGLYRNTLDTHGVTLFEQRAVIDAPGRVRLADGRLIEAAHILIATGGWPRVPDCPGAEHGITSNEVFHLPERPARLAVIGGGYIANEFAGVFNALGSRVTIINRGGTILRGYDAQVTDRLVRQASVAGIDFRFNMPLERIERHADGSLSVHGGDQPPVDADVVLVATGRVPNTRALGLEDAGVATTRDGAIAVDAHHATNVPGIHAVGDVTDRIQLTPVAIREGQAFSDRLFGNRDVSVPYDCVPSAVFSQPPIGAVGLTEAEARERHGAVRVFTADFRPMRTAFAGRDDRALFKLVVDDASDRVLGVHMIGPDAPEIIQAAAIAVTAGLTKAQFDQTVALHPTMAEELVLMK